MRKIKLIILTIFFLALSPAIFACVCANEPVQVLLERADFVVIGKAITNKDYHPYLEKSMNNRNEGANVLFEVESVFKGDLKRNEKIFIYQFGSSCDRIFKLGESYIIFGKTIKEFSKANFKKNLKDSLSPPPPPPFVDNGKVELHSNRKMIRFLNNQTSQYKTATTDLCNSLDVDSQAFASTIKHLKKK